MKRNYTVQDIADYLDELGFKWIDNLVKDYAKEKYVKMTIPKKEMNIYIDSKRSINGTPTIAKLEVDNETFVLCQGVSRLDMSEDWQEFLMMKRVGVRV